MPGCRSRCVPRSVVRALASHTRAQRFKSTTAHQCITLGRRAFRQATAGASPNPRGEAKVLPTGKVQGWPLGSQYPSPSVSTLYGSVPALCSSASVQPSPSESAARLGVTVSSPPPQANVDNSRMAKRVNTMSFLLNTLIIIPVSATTCVYFNRWAQVKKASMEFVIGASLGIAAVVAS